jgi:diguanylate cyclase (GGDEF)-like protein
MFDSLLQTEWQRSKRHAHVFSLVSIELNHQPEYPVSDEALRQVGFALQAILQRSDLAARMHEEAFIVLLPETTSDGAQIFVQRIQKAMAQATGGDDILHPITVNIAIAQSSEASGQENMLALLKDRQESPRMALA